MSKTFIVKSKDLFDEKKNPQFSLSPKAILKNKKIKKYLACIWCGGEITKTYAKYCSKKCRKEALGQKVGSAK